MTVSRIGRDQTTDEGDNQRRRQIVVVFVQDGRCKVG
jgi:hypothetical protein